MSTYYDLLFQRKYDEARECRMDSVPDTLYKFCSLSDADVKSNNKKFETLLEESSWISAISEMNDPYEFNGLYLDADRLREANYPDDVIQKLENDLNLNKDYGFCSFTKHGPEYLPMWAYYTNKYSGYCVEYSVVDKARIWPLSYEKNRVGIAVLIDNWLSAAHNGKMDDVHFYSRLMYERLYMKDASWKHEDEYRVIAPLDETNPKGRRIKNSEIGIKAVRIIAGFKCEAQHSERLKQICDTLHIGFSQATLSKNSYSFEEEVYHG